MNAQLVRSAKRAKWRVTSQWVSYDAARAEHLDSFPDYFNKVSSVYSPFLKPLCLFRQKMSLHVEVLGLSGGRSRWRKHIRFFSPLLSIQQLLFSTRVAFGFSLQPSVCGEIEKRQIRGPWGPFLETPGNLTGPKSYFEIKVSRKLGCVLTSNEVHFVSLADKFTVQFSKLLKPSSGIENKTA